MTWKIILAGFLKLFGALADAFRDKQLLDAGEARARASAAEKANADIVERQKIKSDIGGLSPEQRRDELLKWSKGTGRDD